MKYRVKKDFQYEPSGRVDCTSITDFKKGEVYEFEPYKGKCHKPGEMYLVTYIEPACNNGWVWRPAEFFEYFEKVEE